MALNGPTLIIAVDLHPLAIKSNVVVMVPFFFCEMAWPNEI
jgi:hypothetical protein